ncbi:MAG: SDR family oxidoreductase [Candidatus Buchananbacteria bacterium]|nr:SDR family oxidoreductase [Candidatus Buchananbacteria bacterium]
MKALVTGGAGFIGSNLTDELISQGYEVTVLDNLSTGKEENLNPKARFVKADITNLEEIKPHFIGIDYVFHCAALPRVQLSIEDPITSHNININGTLNVLLAAKEAKVKRLVYSASSSAYGDASVMPLTENLLPAPMSPYGLQKYVGEHYARLFSLLYGLETVSLRYFNVYGPRMAFTGAYTTVIAVFLKQNKEDKKLTITGDGTQTRDFTFVTDVVRANIAAATSTKVGQGQVINVGAGDNHTVNEVAAKISADSEHIAARIEPHDTLADTSKAKELLDWQPEINFDAGIEKTINWFKAL